MYFSKLKALPAHRTSTVCVCPCSPNDASQPANPGGRDDWLMAASGYIRDGYGSGRPRLPPPKRASCAPSVMETFWGAARTGPHPPRLFRGQHRGIESPWWSLGGGNSWPVCVPPRQPSRRGLVRALARQWGSGADILRGTRYTHAFCIIRGARTTTPKAGCHLCGDVRDRDRVHALHEVQMPRILTPYSVGKSSARSLTWYYIEMPHHYM